MTVKLGGGDLRDPATITRRRLLKGAAALAVAVPVVYGFGIEPMLRLVVTRYRPQPSNWPPGLNLTIAALSDIHASTPGMSRQRIRQIVETTNALKPDLIVLLGDYVAAKRPIRRPVSIKKWSSALAGLKAPLGVHAILGNRDWWEDREAQAAGHGPLKSETALERVRIPVMENEAIRLEKDGQPFWLAGLGDQVALIRGERQYQGVDDLPGTLEQVTDDAPVILLAHEPDIFTKVPARVALTLSGHTHGGQVRLLGYSPIVPSSYGNRFAYGYVVENNRHLIVSGGLGCGALPVRIGVPPEIVHVTLGGAI